MKECEGMKEGMGRKGWEGGKEGRSVREKVSE